MAMPSKIQAGRGCPECAPNSEKSWDQRQAEANAVGAEYLGEARQLPSKQKTLLRCFKAGHEWKAMPSKIQAGRGCPECAPNSEKSWDQRQAEAKAVGAEYLLPSHQKVLLR